MESRLFLSFWHLQLDNLPEGVFSKRLLSVAEARSLITTARSTGVLLCVSDSDLLAPYKQRELRNHQRLCAALAEHCDIQIDVADFIGERCINPLQFASVRGTDRLLVISCSYEIDFAKSTVDANLAMSIARDSIEFHLIEAVTGAVAGRSRAAPM